MYITSLMLNCQAKVIISFNTETPEQDNVSKSVNMGCPKMQHIIVLLFAVTGIFNIKKETLTDGLVNV